MDWRLLAHIAAFGAMLAGNLLPASGLSTALWYAGLGYLNIDIGVRVGLGIRRRWPYWTAASWRKYLKACAIPAGALISLAALALAIDYKLPIVGTAGSPARLFVVVLLLVFLLVVVIGFATVTAWLWQGDPARQFTWPRRRIPPSVSPPSA